MFELHRSRVPALSAERGTRRAELSRLAEVSGGGMSLQAWPAERGTGGAGEWGRWWTRVLRAFLVPWWGVVPLLGFALPLAAQSLDRQVSAVRDGAVGFRYAAAPGVYGTDDGVIITRRNGHTSIMNGTIRGNLINLSGPDSTGCICKQGPVRVVLVKRAGRVSELDMAVGDRWPDTSDNVRELGEVAPQQAADFLLSLVPDASRHVANEAIVAAKLGRDVVLWRRLLPLARNRSLDSGKRKQVVFWLGQEAGNAVLGPLQDLVLSDDDDIEVRKSAIFALSQHEGDRAVPTLIRLASSDKLDPRLRKQAFFWLAQHDDDPEVVQFFEKVLVGTGG